MSPLAALECEVNPTAGLACRQSRGAGRRRLERERGGRVTLEVTACKTSAAGRCGGGTRMWRADAEEDCETSAI